MFKLGLVFMFLFCGTSAGKYGVSLGNLHLNGDHDVKGDVYVINKNSFFIKEFTYDGKAPDAHFWIGNTQQPSVAGTIVPDELGSSQPLKIYENKNIIIHLPQSITFSNIGWLSVWCRTFNANFGYVNISSKLEVPKPATLPKLKERAHKVSSGRIILRDSKTITIFKLYYDGAGPDAFFLVGKGKPNKDGYKVPDENGRSGILKGYQGKDVTLRLPGNLTWFDLDWFALYCIAYTENFGEVDIPNDLNIPIDSSLLLKSVNPILNNCKEIFQNKLLVRWKVDNEDIYIQLEGRAAVNEYMAFGISGHEDRAQMEGSDVAVVFYDNRKLEVVVVDYYLSSKAQCSVNDGACPDTRIGGIQNINLVDWKYENGISTVTYQRRLASSEMLDKSMELAKATTVVAAIGPLNSKYEVAKHYSSSVTRDLIQINFNEDTNECASLRPEENPEKPSKPWKPLKIRNENNFTAQIGPTGGKRGYTAITGLSGWGIAFWINGLLIPELTVERGVTYTFIVEGGNDIHNKASYHPLYITNNKEGGGEQYQSELWTPKHMVYAGLIRDETNAIVPEGVGRLCEYEFKTVDTSESSETFEKFKSTLKLKCKAGEPGTFNWTPNSDTPDIVYYQCYTHRNLGWKINVINSNEQSQKANGAINLLICWKLLLFLCFLIKSFFF